MGEGEIWRRAFARLLLCVQTKSSLVALPQRTKILKRNLTSDFTDIHGSKIFADSLRWRISDGAHDAKGPLPFASSKGVVSPPVRYRKPFVVPLPLPRGRGRPLSFGNLPDIFPASDAPPCSLDPQWADGTPGLRAGSWIIWLPVGLTWVRFWV